MQYTEIPPEGRLVEADGCDKFDVTFAVGGFCDARV